jgi:hypothetical protein
MFSYRISGLTVRSEMELPGLLPGRPLEPDAVETANIRIRRRPVAERLDRASECGPVWEIQKQSFFLSLPGIGRFLACDGSELDVDPAPGCSIEETIPFLLGTAFSALVLQRGGLVLHASAVAWRGRAYLFCGRSGAGKSTLAAGLCNAGCSFVNDDVCSVETDREGRPLIWSDGRQLKLFDESIAHLSLAARRRGAVQNGIGKYYVSPGSPASPDSVPLAAVYILRETAESEHPAIEHLSFPDAAQSLLNENYRPEMAIAMARGSRQVEITASILKHAAVYRLRRPWSLAGMKETTSALFRHWSEAQ